MAYLRAAGRGDVEGGASIIWSVAEGRRGRRWRETRIRDGLIEHSLLFEVDPDGRFSHLELSTPTGLLTLHPEPDSTLHGNAIDRDGVHHIEGLPWAADGLVLVVGSIVAEAAAVQLLGGPGAGAEASTRRGVRILRDLAADAGPMAVRPAAGGGWEVANDELVRVDARGLPVLAGGADWPLERD